MRKFASWSFILLILAALVAIQLPVSEAETPYCEEEEECGGGGGGGGGGSNPTCQVDLDHWGSTCCLYVDIEHDHPGFFTWKLTNLIGQTIQAGVVNGGYPANYDTFVWTPPGWLAGGRYYMTITASQASVCPQVSRTVSFNYVPL